MRKKRKVIGLTGGIASGKSTVARMFMAQGVPVIETDRIAHDLSDEKDVQAAIIAAFGPESVVHGALNRQYLASIIFSDAAKREQLNQIVHPAVKRVVIDRLRDYEEGIVVVDVPLMYETDFQTLMDAIIVVYAPEELQVQRLMARNDLSEAEALLRIKAQMPLAEKMKKADYVLDNTQTEETLYASFKKLYETLTAMPAEGSGQHANSNKSK